VVAAVEDVVGHHPSGEAAEAQQEGCDRVGEDPGRQVAEDRGDASAPLDGQEVCDVLLTQPSVDLPIELLDRCAE